MDTPGIRQPRSLNSTRNETNNEEEEQKQVFEHGLNDKLITSLCI